MAKFHENTLNLSENIATSFRGATFLTHTVYIHSQWQPQDKRADGTK